MLRRFIPLPYLCVVLGAPLGAPLSAQRQRQHQPAPTLARWQATARPGATTTFWDSVAKHGTPIIDSIPGDTTHVLAAFVYRSDTARNVIIENGVNGWTYALNQLEHVPGTDI